MKARLKFEKRRMRTADLGAEASVPDLLGELILQNHLPFDLGEEEEIYEGYGRIPNAYPYRQYNTYTRKLKERSVQTAVLENTYLRAVFLPEYGGRLWELWDKESGQNLLYTNDVIRFSNLAVRNAWFSGGVEWNIGVIGHSPLTTEPLYTAVLENESGTEILRMYEYERIRGVVYQMDFWLEDEERFLNCRMRITNASSEVIPMYWWSNMAVPEYDGGRVLVPAKEAFTYQEGKVFKTGIPLVNGIDVTDYKKIPSSVDYFFDIPEEEPKYVANVDREGFGLLQISTRRLRSRKLFSWGNGEASDHWQEFLTDRAGRYVEIQAGLGKTQYGCIPMAPHTAWEWMEQYGSIRVEKEVMELPHLERCQRVTDTLQKAGMFECLEKRLQETKSMAKTSAESVFPGRGYGALREDRDWPGNLHLTFRLQEPGLLEWQEFLKSGKLKEPDVKERPAEFCAQAKDIPALVRCVETSGKNNWYAWYQLGLARYADGQHEKAKEAFQKCCGCRENPWGLHGLSCAHLVLGEQKAAGETAFQALSMRKEDVSFQKEGFKILYLSRAYQTLCEAYEGLEKEQKAVGKLKFYYISALYELGDFEKAYRLLEEGGGLEIEDIREGEDSIAQLYTSLYEKIEGRPGKVPYKYQFKAY